MTRRLIALEQRNTHARETTIELVRAHTRALFIRLERAPTLREISVASGRAQSMVSDALTQLERRRLVRFRVQGKHRRLVWCDGVPSQAERVVRKLAEVGALAWPVEQALAAIE
jgi:DNA-binding MarR family transcriptional regulator